MNTGWIPKELPGSPARSPRTFSRWDIALPQEACERGEPWTIQRVGWTIRCMFGADEDGATLEYYATHRMTSDSRYRIYASGRIVEQDAI